MTMQNDRMVPQGQQPDATHPSAAQHKPRLILMGEFSSGKSTLSNILLGGPTLPTQVTATRLPPVHVSYGEPSACGLTHTGDIVEIDLSDLACLTPEAFRSLHVTMQADTLELCDLVDMPGISDPNMPTDTWDALTRSTDHVIWCTHATQAWRQSEAAAWDRMRGGCSGLNLLLVTQFDKLRNARDRSRVLSRVLAETADKFSAVFPVSLLEAMAAGDDFDAWQDSGAHAFMERLVEILLAPQVPFEPAVRLASPDTLVLRAPVPKSPPKALTGPARAEILTANFDHSGRRQTDHLASAESLETRSEPRVIPRRVQVRQDASDRPRPQRPASLAPRVWPAEPQDRPT